MPPTRGHDLKLKLFHGELGQRWDAPHTGARLETTYGQKDYRGGNDAPHTGARLETKNIKAFHIQRVRCPPHGGTT